MSAHESASGNVDWCTPPEVFTDILRGVEFGFDPCASASGHDSVPVPLGVDTRRFATGERFPFPLDRLVWLNPPYGREAGPFLARMVEHATHGGSGIALLPVRSDTAWWHDTVGYLLGRGDASVMLLRGRVSFVDGRTGLRGRSPAFPVALIGWGLRGVEIMFDVKNRHGGPVLLAGSPAAGIPFEIPLPLEACEAVSAAVGKLARPDFAASVGPSGRVTLIDRPGR